MDTEAVGAKRKAGLRAHLRVAGQLQGGATVKLFRSPPAWQSTIAAWKPVSRAGGPGAVAAAAYRCAVRLENQRDGLVHDYIRKTGIVHAEIVLPDQAEAAWALDRSVLWNAAEAAEKRKDARVARGVRDRTATRALAPAAPGRDAREFARDLAQRTGAAVDFAIHLPHAQGDQRNHHAHVLLTTRRVGPEGLGEDGPGA